MTTIDVPGEGIAGERAACYRFLAGLCLGPPPDGLLAMISDGGIVRVLREDGASATVLDPLSEMISRLEGRARLAEQLNAEYTALFVLPSGVIPHESAWLDPMERVGTRITAEVASFYDRAGAFFLEGCKEMPDHLGIELDFMGFLCGVERELEAGGNDDGALVRCIGFESEFLEGHLARWADRCCVEIGKNATSGFYRAFAHLASDFVRDEQEYATARRAAQAAEGDAA